VVVVSSGPPHTGAETVTPSLESVGEVADLVGVPVEEGEEPGQGAVEEWGGSGHGGALEHLDHGSASDNKYYVNCSAAR